MIKRDNTDFSIKAIETNENNLILLIPYNNSDKRTNKLKCNIKKLVILYKDFYKKKVR